MRCRRGRAKGGTFRRQITGTKVGFSFRSEFAPETSNSCDSRGHVSVAAVAAASSLSTHASAFGDANQMVQKAFAWLASFLDFRFSRSMEGEFVVSMFENRSATYFHFEGIIADTI